MTEESIFFLHWSARVLFWAIYGGRHKREFWSFFRGDLGIACLWL